MAAAAMATLRAHQACSRATAVADELPTTLPPAFLAFLKRNGLDVSIYAAAATLPRYVRVKPQAISEIPEIEEELGLKLSSLTWLPNFFSLPPEAQIASTQAYQQGKLYGMDAASGAAVAALAISPGDHVLDVCAAPGAKLCMMAEFLGDSGSLTAVDISRPRLAACRTMLRKYDLGRRTRLYLGDGTSFSLLPLTGTSKLSPANVCDDQCHNEEPTEVTGNSDRLCKGGFQKDARAEITSLYGEWRSGRTRQEKRAAKRAKYLGIPEQISWDDRAPELFFYGVDSGVVGMKVADVAQTCSDSQNTSLRGYDKVLVDAECTHDGSLKHITKYEQWGWETFERRFLNEDRIASITSLQLRLLSNGFRLLNPGGTLVYSTCSFTKDQNEGVVGRFLATHNNAELQEVELARQWPCSPGGLPHTLRFDPVSSNTSGLFMAKLTKLGCGPSNKSEVGGC
ncbi:hypothetical protein KC19_2G010900 [Ceratodon purpureus]|uniref:SAM-dependent MTase RsmB/NOP-type domain-containing protein n=2 Tax=Ceratodon purpureus TaxID=3225 RepID=A0A8T0IRY9_CERPU|nr:hypothetical protein KC19_2G010900 [Ceratodon purpureus]KAG0585427.1 hypothetical protein KC19_2G010900 [Ceratodon purpureus]KAG0585428.1 hypothetical protein KC19_2G010900 [Ceratodon purpureus]KAG0585429.1 hypothetical protein KC19_2G010900 [Ceratodon purpureus]